MNGTATRGGTLIKAGERHSFALDSQKDRHDRQTPLLLFVHAKGASSGVPIPCRRG